ncbi:hypothetical protein [Actinocrispum wychmicini]|uniref:Tetratricopeptide repeat protein n=1 Tax=Actinocrispum wychmicini TaxID=1213861 RepID=A0A4R2IS26_9PSEU|nr:hypothetical protein [Actinocrispum wychmicini]TCO48024.1 hypothetical protein EV192_11677 [Actinocrispum wychmicini]
MDPQPSTELTITDLGNELERYELAATLSPAEFDDYYAKEVELESRLLAFADQHVAELEFGQAKDMLGQIVSLNQEMRSVAGRQLDRADPGDVAYRERLVAAQEAATGLMMLIQGQIHQHQAEEHMLSGRLPDARSSLETAAACYGDLTSSATPHSAIGEIAQASMVTRIEFLDGTAAMQRGRYESAKEFFEEAYAKYGLFAEELARETEGVDDRFLSPVDHFQREFAEQSTYTCIMIKYLDFFCQIQAGNYEDAVAYVTDAVTLYEAWLNRAIAVSLPNVVQQVRRMELEYFRGWQAWGRAEQAIQLREWDECGNHIRNARKFWFISSDISRRHALLGVMTPQFQTANAEMLLRSTLRRRASEQRLHEEIGRLLEENRQLRTNITHYSGGTVTHGNKISVGRDAIGPITSGDDATVHTGAVTSSKTADSGATVIGTESATNTANLADLRALAEQLADLREVMAAGAATDGQRESVRQIELAEEQAKVGDGSRLKEHLKAAGRWALTVAERLALTAAETAIKSSLG